MSHLIYYLDNLTCSGSRELHKEAIIETLVVPLGMGTIMMTTSGNGINKVSSESLNILTHFVPRSV